jgi:hypothetical protein
MTQQHPDPAALAAELRELARVTQQAAGLARYTISRKKADDVGVAAQKRVANLSAAAALIEAQAALLARALPYVRVALIDFSAGTEPALLSAEIAALMGPTP